MDEPFVELTDEEWDARWEAVRAEYPGLSPRHVTMFLQMKEAQRRARHDALAWEHEKGRAFAEGMAEAHPTPPTR